MKKIFSSIITALLISSVAQADFNITKRAKREIGNNDLIVTDISGNPGINTNEVVDIVTGIVSTNKTFVGNVTNSQGQAISAQDVGALPITGGTVNGTLQVVDGDILTSGKLEIVGPDGSEEVIIHPNGTFVHNRDGDEKHYTLPNDKGGVFAMLSDIPVTPLIPSNTLNLIQDKNGNNTAVTIGSRPLISTAPEWSELEYYSFHDVVKKGSTLYTCISEEGVTPSDWSDQSNKWKSVYVGPSSIVVGNNCIASGDYSISEGRGSIAENTSHAEGYNSTATKDYSHAEGYKTTANGEASHAEGNSSISVGYASHAEGENCLSEAKGSHVSGKSAHSVENDDYAYTWQGVDTTVKYTSHGPGTYNINPVGGINGVYVGEDDLETVINSFLSPTNHTFLMAVLKAVGVENFWKTNASIDKASWSTDETPGVIVHPVPKYGIVTATIRKGTSESVPWDGTMPTEPDTYNVTWTSPETEAYPRIREFLAFTINKASETYVFVGGDPGGASSFLGSTEGADHGWATLAEPNKVITLNGLSNKDTFIVTDPDALYKSIRAPGNGGSIGFNGKTLKLNGGWLALPGSEKTLTIGDLVSDGGGVVHFSSGTTMTLGGALRILDGGFSIYLNAGGNSRSLVCTSRISGTGNIFLRGHTDTDSSAETLEFSGDMSGWTGTIISDPTLSAHMKQFTIKIKPSSSGLFGGSISSLPSGTISTVVKYSCLPYNKGLVVGTKTIPNPLKTTLVLYGSVDFTQSNFPMITFPVGTNVDPSQFTVKHATSSTGATTAFTGIGVIINYDNTVTLVANKN